MYSLLAAWLSEYSIMLVRSDSSAAFGDLLWASNWLSSVSMIGTLIELATK